ncbi:MAG TPA: hypothetical protein VF133_05415 [Terriglobales bacterium]
MVIFRFLDPVVNLNGMNFRICWLLLLLPVTLLGQDQQHLVAQPKLPVVDYDACPFEGCTFGKWKVTKESVLYSSWAEDRTKVGNLRPGSDVVGLTGIHLTLQPDKIRVDVAIPELGVQPGDVILRYMYRGEGFADLWAGGQWHKDYDSSFITEKEDAGCMRGCAAHVLEDGEKQWWVNVKLPSGKTGWVLVDGNFDGIDALE